MTDRYSTLTVVLESDIREDDAEHIINAIYMLKGVLSVKGNITDQDNFMAEERAKRELQNKLRDMLWP